VRSDVPVRDGRTCSSCRPRQAASLTSAIETIVQERLHEALSSFQAW
jgi:hypothetical protein